jgi:hypothetical protein
VALAGSLFCIRIWKRVIWWLRLYLFKEPEGPVCLLVFLEMGSQEQNWEANVTLWN